MLKDKIKKVFGKEIEDKKEDKTAGTYNQSKDECSAGSGSGSGDGLPWWAKILDYFYK